MKAKCHKCKYCIQLSGKIGLSSRRVLCNIYRDEKNILDPIWQPSYCGLFEKREKRSDKNS